MFSVKSLAIVLASLACFVRCAPAIDADYDVVTQWNITELEVRQNTDGFECRFPTAGGRLYRFSVANLQQVLLTVSNLDTVDGPQRGLSSYPHEFTNFAGLPIYNSCKFGGASRTLYEFPIYDDTDFKVFDYDTKNNQRGASNYNPPFRMIYAQDPKDPNRACPEPPTLCAVITHDDPKIGGTPVTPSKGGTGGFSSCARTRY